ncbi:hypothetical protein FOCC_FOCC007067, partial [Frankliniella occidentalis]
MRHKNQQRDRMWHLKGRRCCGALRRAKGSGIDKADQVQPRRRCHPGCARQIPVPVRRRPPPPQCSPTVLLSTSTMARLVLAVCLLAVSLSAVAAAPQAPVQDDPAEPTP